MTHDALTVFSRACDALGLRRPAGPAGWHPRREGKIDGVAVSAEASYAPMTGSRGEHGDSVRHCTARVEHRFALSLGLGLRAHTTSDRSRRANDPLEIASDDPAHARALLLGAGMPAALAAFVESDARLEFDDAGLRYQRGIEALDTAAFTAELRAFAALVRALESARAACPPPDAASAHAGSVLEFARARGLEACTCPLRVWGRTAHGVLFAHVRVENSRALVDAGATLDRAPEPALRLESAPDIGALSQAWASVTGRDVQLGDAAFDQCFLVQTANAGAARERLGPDVRAALVVLGRAGTTVLEGATLSLRDAVLDPARPAQLVEIVEALVRAADGLSAAPQGPERAK